MRWKEIFIFCIKSLFLLIAKTNCVVLIFLWPSLYPSLQLIKRFKCPLTFKGGSENQRKRNFVLPTSVISEMKLREGLKNINKRTQIWLQRSALRRLKIRKMHNGGKVQVDESEQYTYMGNEMFCRYAGKYFH